MIKFSGSFHVKVTDKYGKVKFEDTGSNVTTTAALPVISGLVGNTASQTAFTFLAIGTGSTAASSSQTALVTEITDTGLARSAATVSRTTTNVTNDTLQLTFTWTATGAKTIAETGIFNASSSGTMLARRVLAATITTANTDTVAITYKVIFT